MEWAPGTPVDQSVPCITGSWGFPSAPQLSTLGDGLRYRNSRWETIKKLTEGAQILLAHQCHRKVRHLKIQLQTNRKWAQPGGGEDTALGLHCLPP